MGTHLKPVDRKIVQAFYEAYAERDVPRLAPLLDENARWTINGPVELLHFCGVRHGKRAVLDMIEKEVPRVFEITGFVPDTILVDGDCAATLNRLSARNNANGHTISYRVAQFVRFRAGKVIDYCSVIDSFDAAEQVLGHPIALAAGADAGDLARI